MLILLVRLFVYVSSILFDVLYVELAYLADDLQCFIHTLDFSIVASWLSHEQSSCFAIERICRVRVP